MFPVSLGRKLNGPGAIFTDHCAGDSAAAAVLDLNRRARLAGATKGWSVIVGYFFRRQHTLLITRFIRNHKRRRRAFDLFSVVDDPGFGFTVAAVRQ